LVVIIDTLSAIFGRFHIVAVAMKKLEVGEFIFPALGTGKNMVDFQQIPVLQEQLAVSTTALISPRREALNMRVCSLKTFLSSLRQGIVLHSIIRFIHCALD
jgi:hypothetical protein